MTRMTTCLVFALFIAMGASRVSHAAEPVALDASSLQAWAAKPWNKGELMNTTVEVGHYRNVPVVAEFPCSDVCPQYTVRIIHYRLPADVSCASVDGIEKDVLVPIAIMVRSKTFCIPKPLVDSGQYYSK